MRFRVLVVLLGLLMALAVLNVAAPDSLVQDSHATEVGVTDETILRIDSIGPRGGDSE